MRIFLYQTKKPIHHITARSKQWAMQAILLALASLTASCGHAATLHAHDARVVDGDTIEILLHGQASERVRLMGIDAPEKGQDFGNRSRQTLASCVQAGVQTGSLVIHYQTKDRYDRLLGKVLANGTDCNLVQIQQGMAWHYKAYQNEQTATDRISYAKAEQTAYQAKIGLWQMCATAPWQYRRGFRGCDTPDFLATPIPSTISTASTRPTTQINNTQANNTQTNHSRTQNTAPTSTPFGNNSLQCSSLKTMTCKQFSSCGQAKAALACGNHRLDGDKDGVPCEAICR